MSDTIKQACKCCDIDDDCINGLCTLCSEYHNNLQKQVDLLTYGLLQEKNENAKLREALAKINLLNANKDNDITWLIEQALKEEQDNETKN